MELKIEKFNLSKIADDATVVVAAPRKSGKSVLAREILYYKRDIPVGVVISGTEQMNKFYQAFVPKQFIHYKYSRELIANLLKRQKKIVKSYQKEIKQYGSSRIDPRFFLVLDDFSSDNKFTRHPEFITLFERGRHYHMFILCIINSPKVITTTIRDNTDYVITFSIPNYNMKERLYSAYGITPTKQMFYKILDSVTGDYGCLVMNPLSKQNALNKKLFWYKANFPPKFKIGDMQFWNDQPDSSDDDDEFDVRHFESKSKTPFTVKKLEFN